MIFCYHDLPEQANPSRSITRKVLQIRQYYLGLALRGSCQAALSRVCKPQVGCSIPLGSSWVKTCSSPLLRNQPKSELAIHRGLPPSYFDDLIKRLSMVLAASFKVVKPCVLAGGLELIIGYCAFMSATLELQVLC